MLRMSGYRKSPTESNKTERTGRGVRRPSLRHRQNARREYTRRSLAEKTHRPNQRYDAWNTPRTG